MQLLLRRLPVAPILELLFCGLHDTEMEVAFIIHKVRELAVCECRLTCTILSDLILEGLNLVTEETITPRRLLGTKRGEYLTSESLSFLLPRLCHAQPVKDSTT